jgi:hypothetical protein
MRLKEKFGGTGMRCGRCGCGVAFDGIVQLGEEGQADLQALAAYKCTVCGHGFVDLVDRPLALALESRMQPEASGVRP